MSKIFGFSKKVIFYYFIIFSFHNISIAEEETLLILGDSISAGYGINKKDNWVFWSALLIKSVKSIHSIFGIPKT